SLGTLDLESGIALLQSLGVLGSQDDLRATVQAAGGHAKAVELLATWLRQFHQRRAEQHVRLPELPLEVGSDEERHVLRILAAFHEALPAELKDVLALATAFR